MMVEPVTFDLGGAETPLFSMPDSSGLMPLSLPEEFLHRHESSLPQPSSDAVLRFEAAMGAEPLAPHLAGIKNLVATGTVPMAPAPAVSMGTDPAPLGTDPTSQVGIVAENTTEKPISVRNTILSDVSIAEARVDVPKGTDSVEPKGTDPASMGTDPKQVVGTDPVVKPVIVKEREVSGREVPVATEAPVAPKAPVVAKAQIEGTDPISLGTDPTSQVGIVAENTTEKPVSVGNIIPSDAPIAEARVDVHKGTDPAPQAVIVPENTIERSISGRNAISSDAPIAEARVDVHKGTGPKQVVGTESKQIVGTDPVMVGTDPVMKPAAAKEGEVLGREIPIASKAPVAPEVTVVSEAPVVPEVPVAPNRESYVASVDASAKDVPVAPVREVAAVPVAEEVVGKVAVADKVAVGEPILAPKSDPTPKSVQPTEAMLSPEAAKPTVEAKPEVKLESAPVVDMAKEAKPKEEVVSFEAEKTTPSPLQAMPVAVTADTAGTVDAQSVTAREVSAISAASARTEAVVEVVNELIEAVVSQISVTPSLVQGEGEVVMTLKASVLDGSDIRLSAKDGSLSVVVTPATPEAAQAVAAAVPRLEVALAEHVPTFRQVAVKLVARKGSSDEIA